MMTHVPPALPDGIQPKVLLLARNAVPITIPLRVPLLALLAQLEQPLLHVLGSALRNHNVQTAITLSCIPRA